jgi:hypothetical protein
MVEIWPINPDSVPARSNSDKFHILLKLCQVSHWYVQILYLFLLTYYEIYTYRWVFTNTCIFTNKIEYTAACNSMPTEPPHTQHQQHSILYILPHFWKLPHWPGSRQIPFCHLSQETIRSKSKSHSKILGVYISKTNADCRLDILDRRYNKWVKYGLQNTPRWPSRRHPQ